MKKEGNIVRYTVEELRQMKDKSDWERVRNMTEEELEAAIASDPDADIGPVDWTTAFTGMPWEKEKISMRIDKDVLAWFKSKGPGYQTRINAVLRHFMKESR